ncbi:GTP binding protein [Pseudohyphozyma bogoriensis]|nr:GTP binding protein [Pseudohyphozyma bogoriensis]
MRGAVGAAGGGGATPVKSPSKIPTAAGVGRFMAKAQEQERKTSGSSVGSVREEDGAVKENRKVSGELVPALSSASSSSSLDKVESSPLQPKLATASSPSVPFKPVRHTHSASTSSVPPPSTPSSTTPASASINNGFKPSRIPISPSKLPRSNSNPTLTDSPPLQQAPYEIPPIQKETAPFNHPAASLSFGRPPLPTPNAADNDQRRVLAGTSAPPPMTPPRQSAGGSPSTPNGDATPTASGLLTSHRMKGPRAPAPHDPDYDYMEALKAAEAERNGEESERPLRHKASSKTVTWAATEEVLEFEVEDASRRESNASSLMGGGSSEEGSEYDDEEEEDRRVSYEYDDDDGAQGYFEEDNSGFEEGGSLVIHNDDSEEEEEDHPFELTSVSMKYQDSDVGTGSTASTAGTVDDVLDEIDKIRDTMEDEMAERELAGDIEGTEVFNGLRRFSEEYRRASATSGHPTSAFSEVSSVYTDEPADDTTSVSSYDEDGDDLAASTMDVFSSKSTTSAPPAPTTSAPSIAAPSVAAASSSTSTGMTTSSSAYSLPDLPENSPFMGFDDDGAASSVVTIDLNGARPTSMATSTAPLSSTNPDSPILSAFAETPSSRAGPSVSTTPLSAPLHSQVSLAMASTPVVSRVPSTTATPIAGRIEQGMGSGMLSREASVVGSEVSTASTGSIRSGGRFAQSKKRFEERMKENELLFGSAPTSPRKAGGSGAMNLIGSPDSNVSSSDVFSPQMSLSRFPDPPRMGGGAGVGLGLGLGAAPSGRKLPEVTEKKEGELTTEMVEELESPLSRIVEGKVGVGRRRSRSTGDVHEGLLKETSVPMQFTSTMPELELRRGLDDALPGANGGFANSLESDFDYIINRDRSYRVRERNVVVQATDGSIATIGNAGDVDPGKTWRKKRPSDVHLTPSFSQRSIKSGGARDPLNGQCFVRIVGAEIDGLPLPRESTDVQLWLTNGKTRVKAADFELASSMRMDKEFELDAKSDLEFAIELVVPLKIAKNGHLLSPSVPPPTPSAPSSPRKPSSTFRGFFSSPKKAAFSSPKKSTAVPPVPSKLLEYLAPNTDVLGRVPFRFADLAPNCRAKRTRYTIDLQSAPGAHRTPRGKLTVELFFLPHMPKSQREGVKLPGSIEAAVRGLAAAEKQLVVHHEGTLTQMGGDCTTWRRRDFKAFGTKLVPYNQVTKRAFVELDFVKVVSVFDPDEVVVPPPSTQEKGTMTRSTSDLEDDPYKVPNSFRLRFEDADEVAFYADSMEEKLKWVSALRKLVGAQAVKPAPAWATKYIKWAGSTTPAVVAAPPRPPVVTITSPSTIHSTSSS